MNLIRGRVILAAAKLALFYGGMVVLEMAAIVLVSVARLPTLAEIGEIAPWLVGPMAAAFLLLATARRWGFLALWAILGGLWMWLAIERHSWFLPLEFARSFYSWTILALPLWIIGQARVPSRSPARFRLGALSLSMPTLVLACWGGLFVIGLRVDPLASHPLLYRVPGLAELCGWIWGWAPFLLITFAMRHMWLGTATRASANDDSIASHLTSFV